MNGLRKFIKKMQSRILLTKDSVVRSEHFTRIYKIGPWSFADCFQGNFRVELMGTKSKARLFKPGAVPNSHIGHLRVARHTIC